jgi:hypothetical protein
VGLVAEREQGIINLVRLRRAERGSRETKDIAAVRADLERALGPTVPRAVAARALGISQTALDRWIAHGDIPAVVTPVGRREVPLRPLIELVVTVDERKHDTDDRHPLASILRERRAEAQRLDPNKVLPPRYRRHIEVGGHRRAELNGLAYHRAVAQRLNGQLVEQARERLRRWQTEGKIAPLYGEQWEQVLAQPLTEIRRLISRDDERSRDLRQNSPFAGSLTEPERRRVLETVGQRG